MNQERLLLKLSTVSEHKVIVKFKRGGLSTPRSTHRHLGSGCDWPDYHRAYVRIAVAGLRTNLLNIRIVT